MISAYKVQPRQEIKGCQPCARPHSAGSVPPAPPLTSPQAPQNARLMTALHSRARLRPARSQMSTGHLRKPLTTSIPHRHQTCRAEEFIVAHLPGIACPVGCNTKAVSVEPVLHSSTGFAKASPSPPFSPVSTDAIIPRTWKTCGLLRRRLLRSASLAHSHSAALHSRLPGLHYARSAPNPTRLPDGSTGGLGDYRQSKKNKTFHTNDNLSHNACCICE